MVCAIVDVGSNTIRLLAYKCSDGNIEVILSDKTTAGLSGYVENGRLSEKGIAKACDVLLKYKKRLSDFNINDIFVFATASLRNISNTQQAVDIIKEKTGISVDVLSGEEEARLDYIGVTRVLNSKDGVIIDIGGGSTELVGFINENIIASASLPIGSLNLYLKYVDELLPDSNARKRIKNATIKELTCVKDFEGLKFDNIYGVGGTIRATLKLCNDIFDLPKDNKVIEVKNIRKLLNKFKKSDKETIRKIVQIVPDRIHTVLPGMIALDTLAERLESKEITISKYGVREGYLYKNVLKEANI